MDLLDRVRRFIVDRQLAGRDTRVVVALSGGSDSVALAHLVRELAEADDLLVAGFAHFNHQLRPAARDEERFCRELAASFGWPIDVESEDVGALAKREGRSIEHAARVARHAFYERARLRLGADRVALGHTLDDQAETFLLRLVRGAGPRGLGGMHARIGSIVRPLLECRRIELRAYLQTLGAKYVEDESNADVAIPRNRVRAELLPLLERRFNPGIAQVLADEAGLAQETWAFVETAIDSAWDRVVSSGPDSLELDVEELAGLPLALRHGLVWRAMNRVSAGRPVSFRDVRQALRLLDVPESSAARGPAKGIDVPGQRVERLGSRLVLRGRAAGTRGRRPPDRPNFFELPLSIPGEVTVPGANCSVSAELVPAGATPAPAKPLGEPGEVDEVKVIVRSDLSTGPWRVRNRRPGDRFRPVGLGGHKKLQDYFVDRKVAREERDRVPIVIDAQDRIVWVAGHGIDEGFRVTDPAKGVIILRLKHLGGRACTRR